MSKSNKYEHGKIYKLVCNKTGLVYIGSTTEVRLCRRLAGHVSNYKRYIGGKGNFITSFRIIENGDSSILLLEEYPCESKDQLTAIEAKHIREVDCVNKNIPGRSGIEYRENNKDHINDRMKEYYQDNKDRIKEYRECNKDIKKEYYQNNKDRMKDRMKEYYKDNKDKIIEHNKEYYQDNKEYRKEYRECNKDHIKEYYQKNKERLCQINYCECGGQYSTSNKIQHIKTKKHQEYLQGDWIYIWK
jgi:hypothetical protein